VLVQALDGLPLRILPAQVAKRCPVEIIVKKLLAAGGERQHALTRGFA
jgi:hypothetical protein